jgi:hypothetical protein
MAMNVAENFERAMLGPDRVALAAVQERIFYYGRPVDYFGSRDPGDGCGGSRKSNAARPRGTVAGAIRHRHVPGAHVTVVITSA